METVTVTQHLMPDGREKDIQMGVPGNIARKASEIKAAGLSLRCEMLTTGEIAFYISNDKDGEDISCEIAQNGPGPNSPANVFCKMVSKFAVVKKQPGKEKSKNGN